MRIFILFICVLCFSSCFSQSLYNNIYSPPYTTDLFTVGQYDTAQLSWGISPTIYDICSDLDGNMYICGDAGLYPKFNNSTIWTDDCFIAKFSPEGQLLLSIDLNVALGWDSYIHGLNIDNQKNIYACFEFDNTCLFSGTLYYPTFGDWLICKWDQFGNEVWAQQIDVYRVIDLCVNSCGETVACIGHITDSLVIDSITYHINNISVNNAASDIFVASFDAANGHIEWVTATSSAGSEEAYRLCVDNEGQVYVPISFTGNMAHIGSAIFARSNTHEPQASVLCKFDANGSVIWGLLFNYSHNVRNADFYDNCIYLCGQTYSDTLAIANDTLFSYETSTSFVCKVNYEGILEWITPIDVSWSPIQDCGLSTNEEGESLIYARKSGNATVSYNGELIDSSESKIAYFKINNTGELEWYKGYFSLLNVNDLHGLCWGGGKDFYSLVETSPYGPPLQMGNYSIYNPEDKIEFIPKMYDYSQQDVILPQGWGMVSSFINPMEDSLDILLEDVDTNMTIMKDPIGQVYWPQYSVNTIGNWDFHDGYQSKMTTTDTLRIVGERQKPNTTEIPLTAGWNMISYLNITENNVDSVFAPYTNQTIIVKDGAGLVFWPQYNLNLLGEMSPGKGYQIKTNQAVGFYYPSE